jgi:RNA polymerase sigma factor (sigma-70 family)
MDPTSAALSDVAREEWGRLTSLLVARFRRLDLVEDALGDAFEAAARRWPQDGTPDNPAAWLLTTARRRILDRLRAETMHQRKMPLLVTESEHREVIGAMADPGDLVEDDLLRLILMCAHPALPAEGASALALRLVLGVSTYDLARLFLVSEPTMAARITRAKKKIVGAGIPFAIPDESALPERLDSVARTAYLAFTAGYAPGSGPDLLRAKLAGRGSPPSRSSAPCSPSRCCSTPAARRASPPTARSSCWPTRTGRCGGTRRSRRR